MRVSFIYVNPFGQIMHVNAGPMGHLLCRESSQCPIFVHTCHNNHRDSDRVKPSQCKKLCNGYVCVPITYSHGAFNEDIIITTGTL